MKLKKGKRGSDRKVFDKSEIVPHIQLKIRLENGWAG